MSEDPLDLNASPPEYKGKWSADAYYLARDLVSYESDGYGSRYWIATRPTHMWEIPGTSAGRDAWCEFVNVVG